MTLQKFFFGFNAFPFFVRLSTIFFRFAFFPNAHARSDGCFSVAALRVVRVSIFLREQNER